MSLQTVAVDDDQSFLKFLTFTLAQNDHQVTPLPLGRDLISYMVKNQPDLILLDRLLPDVNGFTLCEKIKLRYPFIPVLMFSTMGEAEDIVDALLLGADEYLPKPFSSDLLMAKVKTLLRRYQKCPEDSHIVFGDLVIDRGSHHAKLGGKELVLTKTEYQLLVYLLERRGLLVSHKDILADVLGYQLDSSYTNIFFHVNSLRKKLGIYRKFLKTIRGFGYRLENIT